jgi:hypothetical protein
VDEETQHLKQVAPNSFTTDVIAANLNSALKQLSMALPASSALDIVVRGKSLAGSKCFIVAGNARESRTIMSRARRHISTDCNHASAMPKLLEAPYSWYRTECAIDEVSA